MAARRAGHVPGLGDSAGGHRVGPFCSSALYAAQSGLLIAARGQNYCKQFRIRIRKPQLIVCVRIAAYLFNSFNEQGSKRQPKKKQPTGLLNLTFEASRK